MIETLRIHHQLGAAFDGEPWYGPPVWQVLDGVRASDAARRPIPQAHSIWELVLHMTYWRQVVIEALAGRSIAGQVGAGAEDWSPVEHVTEEAWSAAKETLRRSQAEILGALDEMPDERLFETVPGRNYALYVLLHGLLQHDVYHAGQIALLRKAMTPDE